MSCGCGKHKDLKRNEVRLLAERYARDTGKTVVFFRCSDYDFTELENFVDDGKKEVLEYFM